MIPEDEDLEPRFSELHQQIQDSIGSGDHEQAEGSIDELFELAVDSCINDPTPYFVLSVTAGECEENSDWSGAESAYMQILELPDAEPVTRYFAHRHLASLYRLLNRESDALEHASLAIAAVREDDDPMPLMLAMAQSHRASLLFHFGRAEEARPCIEEGLAELDADEMFDIVRGGLLIQRAHCEVNHGRLSQAKSDLKTAFPLFGRWKNFEMAAGVQSSVARWWSVQGMVHSAKRNHAEAVKAWQKAVAICQQIDTLEHCQDVHTRAAIARMLHGLTDALKSAGHANESEATSAEAEVIFSKLGLPTE